MYRTGAGSPSDKRSCASTSIRRASSSSASSASSSSSCHLGRRSGTLRLHWGEHHYIGKPPGGSPSLALSARSTPPAGAAGDCVPSSNEKSTFREALLADATFWGDVDADTSWRRLGLGGGVDPSPGMAIRGGGAANPLAARLESPLPLLALFLPRDEGTCCVIPPRTLRVLPIRFMALFPASCVNLRPLRNRLSPPIMPYPAAAYLASACARRLILASLAARAPYARATRRLGNNDGAITSRMHFLTASVPARGPTNASSA